MWPAPANSARRRGLEREEGESHAKRQTANADHAGKPRGSESVVTKWVEESIPAATFDVPAGYKKKELPRMGG